MLACFIQGGSSGCRQISKIFCRSTTWRFSLDKTGSSGNFFMCVWSINTQLLYTVIAIYEYIQKWKTYSSAAIVGLGKRLATLLPMNLESWRPHLQTRPCNWIVDQFNSFSSPVNFCGKATLLVFGIRVQSDFLLVVIMESNPYGGQKSKRRVSSLPRSLIFTLK